MPVYEDKFSEGDRVTWRDEDKATLTQGRQKWGDGPFTIEQIWPISDAGFDRDPMSDHYMGEQSPTEAAGHTQHVSIAEIPKEKLRNHRGKEEEKARVFSGSFFRKID